MCSEKKIKILLLSVYCYGMRETFEEIGISYIASYLRQSGFEVLLLGQSEDNIDYKRIEEFKPNIVGLPMYDISKNGVCRVVEAIHNIMPDTLFCIGGTLPTYNFREIMEQIPLIDFVIRGEGELTWLELVEHLNKGKSLENIEGLIYRSTESIIVNPPRNLIENIGDLPWPARDILKENKLKTAVISSSRGCTGKCSFCASQLFWKKWRGREPIDVVDEIEYIVKEYGVRTFNFIDGSFEDPGINLKRVRGIAEEIIRRQLNISYFVDLRAEFFRKADEALIDLLKKSGLCGACIGYESANEYDLKFYQKYASVSDNVRAAEACRKYEINVVPGFINFNPYSTFEGLRSNIEFMEEYQFANIIHLVISRVKIFTGTVLYEKIKEDNLLLLSPEYNEYGYKFVDERITPFYNYLSDYTNYLDKESDYSLRLINYYSCQFQTLLIYLKRQFAAKQYEKARNILNDFIVNHKNNCSEINSSMAKWFKSLLDLARENWDIEKANNISSELLNASYIKEVASRLNNEKNKLFTSLVRIDLQIAEYFLNIE